MAEQEVGTGARPPAPETSGHAVASLVLGIAGYFISVLIPDILAIIFGVKARRRIAQSAGRLTGKGLALAGMILGIVHLSLVFALGLLMAIMMPTIMGAQEQANRVQSATNLRKICLAVHFYAVEQNDRMPQW